MYGCDKYDISYQETVYNVNLREKKVTKRLIEKLLIE